MPELPEVETVRRGLEPVLSGQILAHVEVRRADLRFPFPDDMAARLTGRRVEALRRRAKYLLADLDHGETLIMHLGMSGSFRIAPPAGGEDIPGRFHNARGKLEPHDHVVFDTRSGARITYNDPRRFGFMLIAPTQTLGEHPLLKGIGVEPLGPDLDPALLSHAFAGRETSLKAALLDQRLIAGLGNIYVCEALFRAGLSPLRKARTLAGTSRPGLRAARLAESIRTVLTEAVAAGGSTLRDHIQANGELGYFQHAFRVYDRAGQPCVRPGCGGTVRRVVQNGRSTFYCPACQR